jgi:hypothetical protein
MPNDTELPGTETAATPEAPVSTSETASEKPAKAPKNKPASTGETTAPVTFEVGQTVKHANGETYTVRLVTSEGVALEGVANLVDPSALTLA